MTAGKATSLLTPSGKLKARYGLVEASDLIPSHNAQTFAKNPEYPEGVQERAYDTSKEAQTRVIEQAQNYDPAYTINSNPDAVNGPPVITPEGIVLGGNSRAMSTQRAYSDGAPGQSYKDALASQASDYGLSAEQVREMREPVLVREIEVGPKDEMRRLGTELNKSMTGALGVSERAVSAGKNIKPATLARISDMMEDMGPDATLRELMSKRGDDLARMLVNDGALTARERPLYVDTATGGLSEEGKTFFERALIGAVVDDSRLMDSTPKSILNKIGNSLGQIAKFAGREDDWNLLPVIRVALAEHADIVSRGSTVDLQLAQSSMFGNERNPVVDAMVRALAKNPTDLRSMFREYAQGADYAKPGQSMLLGPEPKAYDSFNHSFGASLTEDAYYDGLIQAAGQDQPEEAVGPEGDENLSVESQEKPRSVSEKPSDREQREVKTGSPTTLRSGFLDPSIVQEIFPDVADRIRQWSADTETAGDLQKEAMRETRGEKDRKVAIAIKQLQKVRNEWTLRSRADSITFFNAVEHNAGLTPDSLRDRDKELAKLFDDAFKKIAKEIKDLRPEVLESYIEHYFPHIWKNPSGAGKTIRDVLQGKRPFAGRGSFLKRRTIPTIQDGIDMGLTPESWNPVDLFLMKYNEMAQWLMGHQTLQMMKEAGTAKFVGVGQKAPDGWSQLDDKIGSVYRRVKVLDEDKLEDRTMHLTYPGSKKKGQPGAFSEDIEDSTHGAIAIAGHYYAPPDAATAFNNFVSRGLAGRSRIYDGLQWVNNNINALQLGISAFHFTTTAANASTSALALGIEQLIHGQVFDAAKNLTFGASTLPAIVQTAINGSRLMREYLDPGAYAKFAAEAAAVAEAGGRAKMNTLEVSHFRKMLNAFRNKAFIEGVGQLPATILQSTVAPVMDYWVPRMKMGAFYALAHDILNRQLIVNPDGSTKMRWSDDELRRRMQRAWSSIDNRFGQVVYDNLFWHKALRDVLMLATRSVGWNYGDVAEIGGGALDTLKEASKAMGLGGADKGADGGEPPRFTGTFNNADVTHRMAFLYALPVWTALLGAALTYLWNHRPPHTWKDYFYPPTPDGERHSIPGYMKDLFAFAEHPVSTVLNKMAPIWSLTAEAINNRDFYGTEIRHKDDRYVKQAYELAQFAAKGAKSFSIAGTEKLLEKKGEDVSSFKSLMQAALRHPGDVILGNLGFQPAPAFIQNSPALNLAREYAESNKPAGTRTQEQFEKSRAKRSVEDMYRTGNVQRDVIAGYIKQGLLTEEGKRQAMLNAKRDPLLATIRYGDLSLDQVLNVYSEANGAEQSALKPVLESKAKDIQKETDPEKRQEMRTALNRALHGPRAPMPEGTTAAAKYSAAGGG